MTDQLDLKGRVKLASTVLRPRPSAGNSYVDEAETLVIGTGERAGAHGEQIGVWARSRTRAGSRHPLESPCFPLFFVHAGRVRSCC